MSQIGHFIRNDTPSYVVSYEPSTETLYINWRHRASNEQMKNDLIEGIRGLKLEGGEMLKIKVEAVPGEFNAHVFGMFVAIGGELILTYSVIAIYDGIKGKFVVVFSADEEKYPIGTLIE